MTDAARGQPNDNPGPVAVETLEARRLMSVFGIDVSHWQGTINWGQVRAAGKEFAFVKASEGTGYVDNRFTGNMQSARSAGVLAGAYHFARPDLGNSGAAEARHFVATARSYMTTGWLRPVLDLEVGANLGRDALSNWVNAFMGEVRASAGVVPLIYLNSNYAANYVNTSVAQYDVWIANWGANDGQYDPNRRPGTGVWGGAWDFWQYTSRGSVQGIAGNVDLDVFGGDRAALERDFVVPSPLPPDRFEANDTFAAARDLGTVVSRREDGLSIHAPSNDDYYRFTAAANGTLTADLFFRHAGGDVDLFLYDAAGTELAKAESADDDERLTAAVTGGATYVLRVIGWRGAINADYDLALAGPAPLAADVADVSPDPRTAPVDAVTLSFDRPVSGFDLADLRLTRDGAAVPLGAAPLTSADGGRTWTLGGLGGLTRAAGAYGLRVVAAGSGIQDASGNPLAADAADGWVTYSTVAGRHVFYNNSAYDAAARGGSDDDAVAPDKTALLPGQTATFANYTSYSKGINGIMIDLAGLPPVGVPVAADFEARIGNDAADPATWRAAPAPAVSVRRGAGAGGSDRVVLTWPDGAIKRTWLRVTVAANARTRLVSPDVFYFGNAPGETGDDPTAFTVNSRDVARTRNRQRTAADLASPYDFNRSGQTVNSADVAVARNHHPFTLRRITAPSAG